MKETINLSIIELQETLKNVYDEKTAYPECKNDWNKNNSTLEQCAVTALIVQYYFGGEIFKHNKVSHYFNRINGEIVDLTKEQFDVDLDYSDSVQKSPNLFKAQTKERFELLLSRVENYLKKDLEIKEQIKKCYKCGNLEKLSCNYMKIGKSNILILGESPAKDGWIVSKKAFYNKDGKLQATGNILNKLLNLCKLSIDDIYFTEVCKCIIDDRKKLRKCSENCKTILFKQIENIDCDVILPMGQHPTETVLGMKINRMSDVVGKQFKINFGNKEKVVIPIYHTSPANPLCYKGNEAIFKNILQNFANKKVLS